MVNNCLEIPSSKTKNKSRVLPLEVQSLILEFLQSLRYGVLEITVHDGRIVQIEKREKIRLK